MQTVAPPSRQSQANSSEIREGCLAADFDVSASLLATRLEESPGTVWIWDLVSSELRAVLIFHNPITHLAWHPTIRELLLVRCEGESYDALCFTWDPLSEGPRTVSFSNALPEGHAAGKTQCSWTHWSGDSGVILFSDSKNMVLGSLAEADQPPPWQHASPQTWTSASSKLQTPALLGVDREIPLITPEDISAADDTFAFKKT